MNAKKCDRCGKFYAPYAGQDYRASKANMVAIQNDCQGGAVPQTICGFDLCPACMEKQIRFLRGAELEEEKQDGAGMENPKEKSSYDIRVPTVPYAKWFQKRFNRSE